MSATAAPVLVSPVAAPGEAGTSAGGSAGGREVLQRAATEGVDILTKLSTICQAKTRCPPMSPSYVGEAKAVMLTRGAKAGLGLGFRMGHGLLLARLPARSPSAPPRWSAPVFLKLTMGHAGFIAGYEQVDSFLLAMTNKVIEQLAMGSHTVLGMEQSMVVLQAEVEDKSDIIAASNKDLDLVGVSHSTGVMLDFSLSGGSLSVNHAKMREAYGEGVGLMDAVKGVIPPPPEMEPLYERLAELVVGGRTESISRTTTSLERFTAGYDPERHIAVGRGGASGSAASPAAAAATTAAAAAARPTTRVPAPVTPVMAQQAAPVAAAPVGGMGAPARAPAGPAVAAVMPGRPAV